MSHIAGDRLRTAPIPGDAAGANRTLMRGKLTRGFLLVVAVALVAVVAGFVVFANSVVATHAPADPRAEGIVVLTGESQRIDDALRLLAEGRASRLLISGVNPSVSAGALANTVDPQMEAVLACCVDLGRDARDTSGNAAETRTWADERGFRSLIVVTSDYHMPRSLAELSGALPGVTLVPYPVASTNLKLDAWWSDGHAFDLLLREYGKYLVAAVRNAIPVPQTAAAGG